MQIKATRISRLKFEKKMNEIYVTKFECLRQIVFEQWNLQIGTELALLIEKFGRALSFQ